MRLREWPFVTCAQESNLTPQLDSSLYIRSLSTFDGVSVSRSNRTNEQTPLQLDKIPRETSD